MEFDSTLANEKCTVNVTVTSEVTLCKLYGPRVFCDIKVTLDFERCQWVIYRDEGTQAAKWIEVARINGQ